MDVGQSSKGLGSLNQSFKVQIETKLGVHVFRIPRKWQKIIIINNLNQ